MKRFILKLMPYIDSRLLFSPLGSKRRYHNLFHIQMVSKNQLFFIWGVTIFLNSNIYFFICLDLIKSEDDEVLFAIAEELGKIYTLINDKTIFLGLLENLARQDETVVREQSAKSLTTICENLSDAEIQNVFAPLVIKLAQGEWFTGRVSSCHLFFPCYSKSGHQKEKLRKKFIELCNEDTPMIRRACASKLGQFAT